MKIRKATLEDAGRLVEIYGYYVENTAVSFEYETPSVEEFKERMTGIMEKYPYLVIEEDDIIYGYAYARAFVGREAYRYSCELTIYLDHNSRGNGYGKKLYEELESELKKMDIKNMYSCIGDPIQEDEYLTKDSERFHQHMGFKKIGVFSKCGYKFNRWYNMIWMEKIIGEH